MSYKKLIIKSTAAIEIEEIIAHYFEINKTIAKKFEKDIRNCFLKISKNPESFQFRYKTIRVIWLSKFPYGIYYLFDTDEVYILSFWSSKEDIPTKIKKLFLV
ncbi:type II toxin-antitoxin system RelE/ParE family toxin [Flavobacterium sp.]|uniref:type II toxin-antitoxin system RelE/ParE family toxin n=1 Tax=Flavobacterium sp. TaxID=239 RepID=UPI00262383EC|nr:type II toxin-antitoxin system RelE/ParE family toxin [Flavobacterium sp.]